VLISLKQKERSICATSPSPITRHNFQLTTMDIQSHHIGGYFSSDSHYLIARIPSFFHQRPHPSSYMMRSSSATTVRVQTIHFHLLSMVSIHDGEHSSSSKALLMVVDNTDPNRLGLLFCR
jgi:hypothetical protein